MRSKLWMATFLTALWAGASMATEHSPPADVEFECNANGAVMSDPTDGTTYYLGKSCDVFVPNSGEGRWWYAASALIVSVGGDLLRFVTEPDCPTLPYCSPP